MATTLAALVLLTSSALDEEAVCTSLVAQFHGMISCSKSCDRSVHYSSPRAMLGDFDGDGNPDQAALVCLTSEAHNFKGQFSVQKLTGPEDNPKLGVFDAARAKSFLNRGRIGSFLAIVFGARGGRSSDSRPNLLLEGGWPTGSIRLETYNADPPDFKGPDGHVVRAPKLRYGAIKITNESGDSSIVYWDGRFFRFHFIELNWER